MNNLTNQILLHIYNNLGINFSTTVSLLSTSFEVPRKISIDIDGDIKKCNLWGAQILIDKIKFRILCGDFSEDDKEYALIIKLDNCPSYGCYLSYKNSEPNDGLIVFALKDNEWLISSTYIQATFLAGMEQLKDLGATWQPLSSYDDLITNIKSLIEYHDAMSESYN